MQRLIAMSLVTAWSSAVLAQPVAPEAELTEAEKKAIEEATAEAEVIEIKSTRVPDATPPGVASVKREELAVLAGSRGDAISAVGNLPGIANASAYDGGGVFAIRGTSGEDSLVLIDGVAVPLAMHFGNVQSVLPTEMIDNIELQPGGFDVEYGRATGGVLAIKSRSSYPTEFTGFAELSFINVGGFVEGPVSKDYGVTFSAAFRRSIVDALLPVFVPDGTPISFRLPPRYYDGQLRVGWASGPHEVSSLLLFSDDRIALNVEAVDPLDPVLTGDITGRESFWRAISSWRYYGDSVESAATVSYGRDVREQTLNGDQLFYRLEPATFYAREALSWRQSEHVRARFGADLEVSSGRIAAHITLPPGEGANDPILADDPLIDFDATVRETRAASWVALDVSPDRAVTVTPQLRADHYSRSDATVLQPRLAVAMAFSPRFRLRSAVGATSRPLMLAEQLRDDLGPERALHATSGFELDALEGLRVSATGFATELSDLVVRDANFMGEDALDAYSNGGSGRVFGGELLVRLQRAQTSGWIAYTVSRSTRVDGVGVSERLFDYDQTHNLTVVGSHKLGKWRFGGRFRLASGSPETPIEGSIYNSDKNFYRPIYGPRNSERTALDHQLDLRVDRRFAVGEIAIDTFLDISNVYSHPKELGYEYNFDYSERKAITDVPILPSFGVRGTF